MGTYLDLFHHARLKFLEILAPGCQQMKLENRILEAYVLLVSTSSTHVFVILQLVVSVGDE